MRCCVASRKCEPHLPRAKIPTTCRKKRKKGHAKRRFLRRTFWRAGQDDAAHEAHCHATAAFRAASRFPLGAAGRHGRVGKRSNYEDALDALPMPARCPPSARPMSAQCPPGGRPMLSAEMLHTSFPSPREYAASIARGREVRGARWRIMEARYLQKPENDHRPARQEIITCPYSSRRQRYRHKVNPFSQKYIKLK